VNDMSAVVNRSSPLPLYVQLENVLFERIREEGLKPGDRLPSEAEIEEQYLVSRATIRTALNRLVAAGRIERIQGLGSFVARPRPTHKTLLNSFTENMRAQGFRPHRRLLRSGVVTPDDEVRSALRLPRGDCQGIERLLLADDRPIAIAKTWLPVDVLKGRLHLFSAESLVSASLYEVLQGPEIGLRLVHGVETIRAAVATKPEARLLECRTGDPTLLVRRTAFSSGQRPVEYSVMTFAGDRYEYHVELAAPE
jgi:GntR family transcriptional regulator